LILGRNTYQVVSGFEEWPYKGKRVIVLSHTLKSVARDSIRDANNSVVLRSDQIWIFCPVSNGVLAEILLARKANNRFVILKLKNLIK
jgi:dihydrofolate reductase